MPEYEPVEDGTVHRSAAPHLSSSEADARSRIVELLRATPIPGPELAKNLPLYLRREILADVLVTEALYRRVLHVPGVVMEFGTRWGRRLALFVTLRELYEPYNFNRRVVGFDTFSGFPAVTDKDGDHAAVQAGSFSVTDGYLRYLEEVLEVHERESMLAHIRRFDLRHGDVRETLPGYLAAHPETIVSLAYFDMDLYEPTKACIEIIRPRLVRGSVVAFDELTHTNFPGETQAVLETLELPATRLEQVPFHPYPIFMVV